MSFILISSASIHSFTSTGLKVSYKQGISASLFTVLLKFNTFEVKSSPLCWQGGGVGPVWAFFSFRLWIFLSKDLISLIMLPFLFLFTEESSSFRLQSTSFSKKYNKSWPILNQKLDEIINLHGFCKISYFRKEYKFRNPNDQNSTLLTLPWVHSQGQFLSVLLILRKLYIFFRFTLNSYVILVSFSITKPNI